jgi:hypothetical protein
MTMNETSQEEYRRRANDCIDDATRSTDPKRRGGFFFALAETWVMLAREMTPPIHRARHSAAMFRAVSF